jgi:hypothetical protein
VGIGSHADSEAIRSPNEDEVKLRCSVLSQFSSERAALMTVQLGIYEFHLVPVFPSEFIFSLRSRSWGAKRGMSIVYR